MSNNRYGQAEFSRAALTPGLLGGIVLLAGLALIGGPWFIVVQYAASILALILCAYAGQAKAWWWYVGLVPIAILWNPVWPLTVNDLLLRILHLVGTVIFVAAGITVKVPQQHK